jgi:hypothetical protein
MHHTGGYMQEIRITQEMIDEAAIKAEELGVLRGSIEEGEGNIYGFVGELVAQQAIGGYIDNSYDYDILMDDGRTTVDVKTKKVTSAPKSFYDCSVANYNIRQKCDYYSFVRVMDDLSVGWYLGSYPKKDYVKDAVFMKKGQIDPSNNFKVKDDCYNLRISKLIHI